MRTMQRIAIKSNLCQDKRNTQRKGVRHHDQNAKFESCKLARCSVHHSRKQAKNFDLAEYWNFPQMSRAVYHRYGASSAVLEESIRARVGRRVAVCTGVRSRPLDRIARCNSDARNRSQLAVSVGRASTRDGTLARGASRRAVTEYRSQRLVNNGAATSTRHRRRRRRRRQDSGEKTS